MKNIFTCYAADYHEFDNVLHNLQLATSDGEFWEFEEVGMTSQGYLGLFWLGDSQGFTLSQNELLALRKKCIEEVKEYE